MCPGGTDAPAIAYSHKQKQKKIWTKGKSLWKPQDDMDYSEWIILKLEQWC